MIRILWIVLFSFAMMASARAQEQTIEQVIEGQISAFRADDFAAAFDFASPGLRGFFKTPQNFEAMIKDGYAMVIDPAETRFLERREIAGSLWQKLLIRDGNGTLHILDYEMIEVDGVWRINAVQVLQVPGVAA